MAKNNTQKTKSGDSGDIHVDVRLKQTLNTEIQCYLSLRQQYNDNATLENYNTMRQCMEKLADLLLLERAAKGSVQAIVEISKFNRSLPSVSSKSQLSRVHGITSDQLRCELMKMDLVEISPILDDKGEVTVESVKKAYFKGDLTCEQYRKVLNTFKLFKDSKPLAEVDSVINVSFDADITNALIDGIQDDY